LELLRVYDNPNLLFEERISLPTLIPDSFFVFTCDLGAGTESRSFGGDPTNRLLFHFTTIHNSSIERKLYVHQQTEWLMLPFKKSVFLLSELNEIRAELLNAKDPKPSCLSTFLLDF
jgi:hypothetical protein